MRNTLHFLTCGHVDDGKSTLIGRFFYEIGVVPSDQVENARVAEILDYARITDGLEDERAQGITIDVAYRYFRFGGRHYRIADTPVHMQYVRNMAVAAADSDCALLLIDASHGIREQTLRHARIAEFFRIRHYIVAVNKMDLVNYGESIFHNMKSELLTRLGWQDRQEIKCIPVSALQGDNVTQRSMNTPWYSGPTLLDAVMGTPATGKTQNGVRFAIQAVARHAEERLYLGMLYGGALHIGDSLIIAEDGIRVRVDTIYHSGRKVPNAHPGQSIAITAGGDVDISRGNLLYAPDAPPLLSTDFTAHLLWLDTSPLPLSPIQCILKLHNREEWCEVRVVQESDPISAAQINTATLLSADPYTDNLHTGLFLLIDPESERVLAVGGIKQILQAKR